MKFHDQMTDEELTALTSEQVDDCAKLLLAKDGLPFPGEKPTYPDFSEAALGKEECFVWEVDGFYFTEREAAEKALAAVNGSLRVESESVGRGGYLKRFPDSGDWNGASRVTVEMKQIPVYLRSTINALKLNDEEGARRKQEIEAWDQEQKDFLERRSEVWKSVYAAAGRIGEAQRREAYMAECLRLADNDQVIARRFFEKRYLPTEEAPGEETHF